MRLRSIIIAAILVCPAFATTYYISFSSGSNANNGLTKATAWKTHPYMKTGASCTTTGSAPSYAHSAGDIFTFKMGDSWPNACFTMTLAAGGSAGNIDTYTYDPTWGVCGTAVVNNTGQAIGCYQFTAGNTLISSNSINRFIFSGSNSFITINGLELTGFTWSDACPGGNGYQMDWASSTNVTISNGYFHGWLHTSTTDCMYVIKLRGNSGDNNRVTASVFDGTTDSGTSGLASYLVTIFDNNIIENMSNGVLPGVNSSTHDNIIGPINQSFDVSDHENCIEPIGFVASGTSTNYIYNNVFHDCKAVAMLTQGGSPPASAAEVDYIWNNVCYPGALAGAPVCFDFDTVATNLAGSSVFAYNNTVYGSSGVCFASSNRQPGVEFATLDIRNNHCITSGSFSNFQTGGTSQTITNNVTSATGTGFNSYPVSGFPPPFAYSPTGPGSGTVGQGQNLTSLATGNLSTLAADTTYAALRGTHNRPPSAAWDAGAYQVSAQSATPSCNLASGTYGSAQAPACTNPNGGTTVMGYTTDGSTPITNGLGTGMTHGTILASGGIIPINVTTSPKLVAGTSIATDSPVVTYTYTINLPASYFGGQCGVGATNCPNTTIAGIPTPTWPVTVAPLGLDRLWDSSVPWAQIMTAYNSGTNTGTYSWNQLDGWMNTIAAHPGVSINYTFGCVPTFANGGAGNVPPGSCGPNGNATPPTDLTSSGSPTFTRFVTDLLARCSLAGHCFASTVTGFELWNEANQATGGAARWTGTQLQLYQLLKPVIPLIKAAIPNAIIFTPSITSGSSAATWMNTWLATEVSNGIISTAYNMHAYFNNNPPEAVLTTVLGTDLTPNQPGTVAGWTPLPWIVGEWGWDDVTPPYGCNAGNAGVLFSTADCIGQMARWWILLASNGGFGAYAYYWNTNIGNNGAIPQFASAAYWAQLYLTGGSFPSPCVQTPSGGFFLDQCPFTQPSGQSALWVWAPCVNNVNYATCLGGQSFSVPAGYNSYRDLGGGTTEVVTGQVLTVGVQPILLQVALPNGPLPPANLGALIQWNPILGGSQ